MERPRDRGRRADFWWRPLASAALIAGLAWTVDWAQCARVLRGAGAAWLVLVLVVLQADRVSMALKWLLLARGASISVSAASAVKSYYVSSFWGSLLPTSVGADVIRIYWLARRGHPASLLAVSVVVERVLGALALAAAGLAALMVLLLGASPPVAARPLTIGLPVFAGLAAVVAAIVFSRRGYQLAAAVTGRLRWPKIQRVMATVDRSLDAYRRRRGLLQAFLGLAVLQQALPLASNFGVARALSIDLPLRWLAVGIPIVLAVSRMPLPVSDYGVKEGLYVLVFSFAGVSLTEAVTLSIVHRVLLLVTVLPGALWTVGGPPRHPVAAVPAASPGVAVED